MRAYWFSSPAPRAAPFPLLPPGKTITNVVDLYLEENQPANAAMTKLNTTKDFLGIARSLRHSRKIA